MRICFLKLAIEQTSTNILNSHYNKLIIETKSIIHIVLSEVKEEIAYLTV